MELDTHDLSRLASTRTIDLTTYGRRSGQPSRIEIWWFHVDRRFIVTGTPGRRDWLANIVADARVVIHADGLDIDAKATPVEDPEFRRRVFTAPDTHWYTTQAGLERLVRESPMVEIHLPIDPQGETRPPR